MKKGKTTLMALTLGALTYLAWLGLDIKNPEKPTPVTTPYEVVSESPAPTIAAAPTPRRVIARKAVKIRKAKSPAPAAEVATAVATEEPQKSKMEIPLPKTWEGTFVKHERPYNKDECDLDRPCAPRGRDGVLLVGVSFSLNGYQPMAPEILSVGSYRERTPLLVYK
ncbi:MAG TPA: hypothetical protein VFO10_01980 [Oligoflexus sp.]|uniref:hypothetical protein n=1 Tax=Oligoflexus sp. TaxID=1971216 RepID=UPI002D7F4AAA|nr:hypothetical protein [Oligoflexus sp.]HET9235987.1 hypothetical protein [Oligoflexus sp.]